MLYWSWYQGFSDSADETLSASRTRDGAQFDFGLPEYSVLAGIDDITHQCELATTA